MQTVKPGRQHPDKGLAGLFFFKKAAGGWKLLAAQPEIGAGTFGEPLRHWRFEQFGKDKWGFVAEESETAQGYRYAGWCRPITAAAAKSANSGLEI